ncbi:MAG: hypothetical protein A3F80_05845 [Candidatus Melainabacteria bacterium RIFCSPLOWO2_12_FULL_35_11]|nr:MAG: hypothetical protein A3F80_05845 [Candidatus Melainabacteria bacterium RIFCSPLOWO2_12_FULL_35_11]
MRLLLTNFVNNNLVISFVSKLGFENSNVDNLKQIIAEGLIEYKEGKTKKLNFSAKDRPASGGKIKSSY